MGAALAAALDVVRQAVTVVAVLIALFALLIVLAWAGQRHLIYLPYGSPGTPEDAGLQAAEPITFTTADGLRLQAWFAAADPPAAATIVVMPGNAGNRSLRAPLAVALQDAGYNVALLEYRGFGGNEGRPTESGLLADARAAVGAIRSRADVEPARLVYLGESIGAGVATALAVEESPQALILRSPFTSLADVGKLHYRFLPVDLLLRDRYPVADQIGGYGGPVLVVAGQADEVVPPAMSARVAEAAARAELVTVAADGHNDPALLAGEELIRAVRSFLDAQGLGPVSRAGQPP